MPFMFTRIEMSILLNVIDVSENIIDDPKHLDTLYQALESKVLAIPETFPCSLDRVRHVVLID